MNLKDVPVIICNYKNPKLTKRCIASVRKFYPDIKIILVDDFSPDYKPFRFKNSIEIRLLEHLGHGNAMDIGFLDVTEDWFFTLDHDVVFKKPGLFEYLWGIKKGFVAVGPEHTYSDDGNYIHAGSALWKSEPFRKYHLSFMHYDLPLRPNINPGVLACRKLEELGYKLNYLRANTMHDYGTHTTSALYSEHDFRYGKKFKLNKLI